MITAGIGSYAPLDLNSSGVNPKDTAVHGKSGEAAALSTPSVEYEN
jgi:hypothetical protein